MYIVLQNWQLRNCTTSTMCETFMQYLPWTYCCRMSLDNYQLNFSKYWTLYFKRYVTQNIVSWRVDYSKYGRISVWTNWRIANTAVFSCPDWICHHHLDRICQSTRWSRLLLDTEYIPYESFSAEGKCRAGIPVQVIVQHMFNIHGELGWCTTQCHSNVCQT